MKISALIVKVLDYYQILVKILFYCVFFRFFFSVVFSFVSLNDSFEFSLFLSISLMS